MDMYGNKLRLSNEHKSFIKDLAIVVISYTPVSGIFDTIRFSHKWFGKKRSIRRTIRYMKNNNRRNYIKSRSMKIKGSYRKFEKKYNLGSGTSFLTIAKMREIG